MKAKRHIVILLVALIATFTISNFTEDTLGDLIKAVYSNLTGKPLSNILLDDSGIPIVDYGYIEGIYIGEQRNPVAICQKAFEYLEDYEEGNESSRRLFLNCVDWLVDNSVKHNNYAILEYRFDQPVYNMTSPWRSGLAQGQALQVLCRAQDILNDRDYLDMAKKLLNSFFLEVENGGVTYKSIKDGWWYEEFADEGGLESRVLNGMMYALLGIHEYYEYTKDSDAKFLFDQGIIALKATLHNYDMNGGRSYYDILGRFSAGYHKIHIQQLNELYDITNEEIFRNYHDRWKKYKEPPFVIRLVQNPYKLGIAVFCANFFVLIFILEILIFVIERRKKKKSLM